LHGWFRFLILILIVILTRLDGFDPPQNFFYCASGWYDAGTLIA